MSRGSGAGAATELRAEKISSPPPPPPTAPHLTPRSPHSPECTAGSSAGTGKSGAGQGGARPGRPPLPAGAGRARCAGDRAGRRYPRALAALAAQETGPAAGTRGRWPRSLRRRPGRPSLPAGAYGFAAVQCGARKE